MKSFLRKHYFLDRCVIIAPGRKRRPGAQMNISNTSKNEIEECVFCRIDPEKIIDKIGKTKNWKVAAVKNLFPAADKIGGVYGSHEVIIDTPKHEHFVDLSVQDIKNVLKMYVRRTKSLMRDKKISYILCFKNEGEKSGASIKHAHSQIFALDFIPPSLKQEFFAANDYRKKYGNCPYCKILENEAESSRSIFKNKHITVFTPSASEYHYEVWILPNRHFNDIADLNAFEINAFARALKLISRKLQSLNLSFNYFLHQTRSEHNQHFYLKIQPRGNTWGGIELGSGVIINPISPERAAKFYRS